ncbi:MAG TPA: glycosyltransferase family 2 protein [Candidatus Binatia bacterium]|jgi:glycosyltransferase involved in cell wall biosynthesis|nr:glycosyltransferase family 2 protein [Candidatus Binatia bacterium]
MQKISVIVPFYNAKKYIRHCITALLSQSYPPDDYEVLMVDNNSTDGSLRVARQFPGLKVLREKKQGAYAARNKGLAEATGAIVAFTDADCVPDKDWLCTIAEAMRVPQARLVLGSRQWARDSSLLSMLVAYQNQKVDFILRSRIKELYYGYTNNMAVRGEIFDQLGPFLEALRGADTVFLHRVVDAYSYDAVCYNARMRVRHLEIENVWQHYQKLWIYGRSNRLGRQLVSFRPLTRLEALRVFQETLREGRYSPRQASLLSLLVALETVIYTAGHLTVKWNPGKRSQPSARTSSLSE